jgi:acetyltransferase-like isoleucine patch superfamily enzyme
MSNDAPASLPPMSRPINPRQMAFNRKAQIAAGAARAALFYLRVRPGRVPIIHSGVQIVERNGHIDIGHLSELHERVTVMATGKPNAQARVRIGRRTSIWYGTVISARNEITIGSDCAISWNCSILDNDMHEIVELPDSEKQPRGPQPVCIADHVWIGASAIILKGVTIGQNAIVAAGAIVTRDVSANTLVAGAPARIIRRVAGWR